MLQILNKTNTNWFVLFFLWAILTGFNLTKAFHMDDAFHLEAARHLMEDPWHPMSHEINWENDPHPMHFYNQPPLFFYMIAGVGWLVGFHEIPMHLFLSMFTFLALYFFTKISSLLSVKNPTIPLILFAFCPATIINQNVMTDVPILSIILAVTYPLLLSRNERKLHYYLISFILVSIGLLIKYSLLPVIPVILMIMLIRKDYRLLWLGLIPMMVLVLWSFWNYLEFGAIHLLERDRKTMDWKQILSFIACLGAIAPFSIALVSGWKRNQLLDRLWLGVGIIVPIGFLFPLLDWVNPEVFDQYLQHFFLGNGIVLVLLLLGTFLNRKSQRSQFYASNEFILILMISSIGAFMALFAPFIATRHVLLCIPFLILLTSKYLENAPKTISYLAILLTLVLGILHGISDWKYADYYRKMALDFEFKEGKTTWTVGHWGWQWYATQQGLNQYHTSYSKPEVGDLMVIPGNISQQKLDSSLRLELVDKNWEDSDLTTFISGSNFAGMYNSFYVFRPPWIVSKMPIDTIYTYQVY